jgi:hypothetical protein
LLFFLLGGEATVIRAQDASPPDSTASWTDTAWTPIVERNGVAISYIFYAKADNHNNGVVLRLRNRTDAALRYAFTVLFRGPEGEASAVAQGTLRPGEMKTGETDGLFWIPFEDGRRIGEVGLRGLRITPVSDATSKAGAG